MYMFVKRTYIEIPKFGVLILVMFHKSPKQAKLYPRQKTSIRLLFFVIINVTRESIFVFVENSFALTLAESLPSLQSVLPSLRLPELRFQKPGSCLEMHYLGHGMRLDINIDKQNLTSLYGNSSFYWNVIKVNIDYSTSLNQVC